MKNHEKWSKKSPKIGQALMNKRNVTQNNKTIEHHFFI